MTPSTSSGQRQPVRLAMLEGGIWLHRVKVVWSKNLGGEYQARCGQRASSDDFWDFDPPEGVLLCTPCKTQKPDKEAIEWDTW